MTVKGKEKSAYKHYIYIVETSLYLQWQLIKHTDNEKSIECNNDYNLFSSVLGFYIFL